MEFLKNFFTNVFDESTMTETTSSFERLSEEELETHLGVKKYGAFTLTDAVRPSYDLKVTPAQGYRHDAYQDVENNTSIPVVMAAASSEILFDLLMEILDPLGQVVDVVLETSHHREENGHSDLYREHIDMPVLKSILWDYQDLLKNDGCTGIAVLNDGARQEVQFDEHKLLVAYGEPLSIFEQLLVERGVYYQSDIKFVTEAEHVHSSSDFYGQQFEELSIRLGMDTMGDY